MESEIGTQIVNLNLLGGFSIFACERETPLPFGCQRVLAALALRCPCDRTLVSSTLYPEGRRSQAAASLRSALWRARKDIGRQLFSVSGQRIVLCTGTSVDLRTWSQRARLLEEPEVALGTDCADLVQALSQELLPGWNEEWLMLDQQRWDQLRLHTLEDLALHLCKEGRFLNAIEASLAAVAIEPFRESARRALIHSFLAEGNVASAVAEYRDYHQLLTRELGVRPTNQLRDLMHQHISG